MTFTGKKSGSQRLDFRGWIRKETCTGIKSTTI